MGLLSLGTPLAWDECKKYADHVRHHGITQLLHIWDRLKSRSGDKLLWGDEIEYIVVSFDDQNRDVKLSLRQSEILQRLSAVCKDLDADCPDGSRTIPTFHPEYGRYMLESTPGSPYNGSVRDLLGVERDMRYRRTLARRHLEPNELPVTLTSFPCLGVPGVFTEPYYGPEKALASHSFFLPDEVINPHARFPTLTANIRQRRGSKVSINLPIFIDKNTPRPFIDPTIPWNRNVFPEDAEAKNGAALEDHIYMDAMGFGMGCCCLQITFQACSVQEARRVYDALVPVAPIMLALTAASPLWRGYIANVDCRWDVIAGSVDDRTEEERGLKPLKNSRFVIPKSRYGSVNSYISEDPRNRPEYNDNPFPHDKDVYDRLKTHGLPDLLAKHFAQLFIRDPLVIFSELMDQDDTKSTDHFENIQSTNWQTLRFKPPPPDSNIGWRVEFRSMEVQLTDFENAAFSIFIVLLSRAILTFGLNFYIPISKVDVNMERAQKRDAARQGEFYFRKSVFPEGFKRPNGLPTPPPETAQDEDMLIPIRTHKGDSGCCFTHPAFLIPLEEVDPIEAEYEEMTLNEVINGKGDNFPGLLGVVEDYVHTLDVEPIEKHRLRRYLDLIRHRANGSLITTATWMREFVAKHPEYKHDSVISSGMNYDLIRAVNNIEQGKLRVPELLPVDYVGSTQDTGGYSPSG